jgi:hypothetical protein
MSVGVDMTERKVKKRIFKFLRPLIRSPDIKLKGNENEDQILDMEY